MTREINDKSVRRLPRKDYEAAKTRLFAQIREAQNKAAEERILARLTAPRPDRDPK